MLPIRYPSRDEARRYRHELRHALEALRGRFRPDAEALAWPPGLDRGILLGLPLRDRTHRRLLDAGLMEGDSPLTLREVVRIPNVSLVSMREALIATDVFLRECIEGFDDAPTPADVVAMRLRRQVKRLAPRERTIIEHRLLRRPPTTLAALGGMFSVPGDHHLTPHALEKLQQLDMVRLLVVEPVAVLGGAGMLQIRRVAVEEFRAHERVLAQEPVGAAVNEHRRHRPERREGAGVCERVLPAVEPEAPEPALRLRLAPNREGRVLKLRRPVGARLERVLELEVALEELPRPRRASRCHAASGIPDRRHLPPAHRPAQHHPVLGAIVVGEYQQVWGADLCRKVRQGDFLVKEPVNPVPDRAYHRRLTPQILVLPIFEASAT